MTNNEIPEVLRAAIAEHRAQHGLPRRPEQRPARIGDIALASTDDLTRLVYVYEVYETHAVVILAHSAPELATDHDRIVHDVTPFPLVIQTDLQGCVDLDQFGGIVGTLDLDQLRCALRGWALAGPADARWRFKASEGDELRRLCATCTSRLLADL